MVPFTVNSESLSEAKALIAQFICCVNKEEPNTLLYKSFQQSDNPGRFIHVMSFSDSEAERFHRQTHHCQEFVAALYPLCEIAPKAIVYNEIN